MTEQSAPQTDAFTGATGDEIVFATWLNPEARFVTVIAHGYGEHARRYDHVVDRLRAEGAVVYAPDHVGHGRSGGTRVLIEDFDDYARDLAVVVDRALTENPGLPLVLIGHSMGGSIASRYLQRGGLDVVTAFVLSSPYIASNPDLQALALLNPIPDVPIDPEGLSRDPEVGAVYQADELIHHGPFLKESLLAIGEAASDILAGPGADGVPALWVHGTADPISVYEHVERAARHMIGAGGRHIRYDGARHELFNETNRDEVIDDVVAFIRQSLPSGR
jgi:alpha-beta hydrolase superfamily lysophospholipase